MKQKLNSIDLAFVVLLLLTLAISSIWQQGIGGCDPSTYVYQAKRFVETGSLDYTSLFGLRITALLPYGLYVYFFGINASITWVATLQFCLLLVALYALLRKADQVVAFYAVALICISTFLIRESTMVMGDIALTFWVNLPLLIYWRFIKHESAPRAMQWGIIAGICWMLAFFAKELALYYLPLFAVLAVAACRQKLEVDKKFWKWFWITVAVLGVASCIWFWLKTGDPLHRFTLARTVVADYGRESAGIRAWKTWDDLLYRLTLQPIIFFVQEYTMGVLALFGLVFLLHRNAENRFWKICLLFLLAVWWWAPQNLSPYYPMWLLYRLWLPLIVPLAICAAYGLKIFVTQQDTKPDRITLVAAGISMIVVSLFLFGGTEDAFHKDRMAFYSGITLFMVGTWYVRENAVFPDLRKLIPLVIILPFLYNHTNRFLWKGHKTEHDEMMELREKIMEKPDAHVAFAPRCLTEFIQLFEAGNTQFVAYKEVHPDSLAGAYLIIDKVEVHDKYNSTLEKEFKEVSNVSYQLETNPKGLGFEQVDETGRYWIYRHRQ